jgi:hypothetical protein
MRHPALAAWYPRPSICNPTLVACAVRLGGYYNEFLLLSGSGTGSSCSKLIPNLHRDQSTIGHLSSLFVGRANHDHAYQQFGIDGSAEKGPTAEAR